MGDIFVWLCFVVAKEITFDLEELEVVDVEYIGLHW